ncbi:hypothetical protein ACH5RR_014021 [Cinchona calisaya]|uniref:Exostosin GT47 domain-containing protein n=1 Tax=Cinchona calisaya TaxID=153742 RepID=A0ABD3A340_9GENT
MISFFKPSSPDKGHNILEKPPKKKAIDLKNTFKLVKSQVSLYHFAWILTIFLFQMFIFLVFFITNHGPISPSPTQQFSPIHVQEKDHHHHQQHHHEGVVIHQLDPPPPSDDDDGEKQQKVVTRMDFDGDNNNVKKPLDEQVILHLPPPSDDDKEQEKCKYGKVYVYDLPPMFNKELVKNCSDLDPWKSKCPAVSNDGFGPNATATLVGTVPEELTQSWWWTDMFSGEIIYHIRMLHYKCRTTEPESATALYVPFYAGLAVSKYLFTNYSTKERDFPCERFLEWIKDQPYWKRSNGSDHFLMLGRMTWDFRRKTDDDWGTKFLSMPLMKNMLKLAVEENRWDPLEISVPYPTGFHPRSVSEIEKWQEFVRRRNRTNLFTFVGAKRQKVENDFRTLLFDHCFNESDSCKLVDCVKTRCSDGSPAIFEAFLYSDFCLQPRGDSDTRKSTFDCLLSGSIPVFFWEGSFKGQYELFLSSEPDSFSVFIDRKEVRNGTSVRRVLEGYSQENIKKMRNKIIEFIPRFLYSFSNEGLGNAKDAFDIAIEEVLQRMVKKPSVTGQ